MSDPPDFTIDVDFGLLPTTTQKEILNDNTNAPLKLFVNPSSSNSSNTMLGIKKYAANENNTDDNKVTMEWTLESKNLKSSNSEEGIFRPSTINLRGETFPITQTNKDNHIYSFVRPVEEQDTTQAGGAIRPISKTRYAKRKWNKKRKQTKNKRQRMNRK